MKKLFLLLTIILTCLTFNSCNQEIFFRDPAIQGSFQDRFWLTDNVRVYTQTESGYTYYFIEGIRGNETITLRTTGIGKNKYPFGDNNSKTATYTLKLGENDFLIYNTSIDRGSGSVLITDYNEETQTVSGKFEFEALNKNALDTINAPKVVLEKGLFYNVPIYK